MAAADGMKSSRRGPKQAAAFSSANPVPDRRLCPNVVYLKSIFETATSIAEASLRFRWAEMSPSILKSEARHGQRAARGEQLPRRHASDHEHKAAKANQDLEVHGRSQ